ncbi:MAG: S41 family peptidase [Candidatus Nomurabacteria bacterium]|nr:S41 family peptidase [Candidatus Nomurabacteria bacterium]
MNKKTTFGNLVLVAAIMLLFGFFVGINGKNIWAEVAPKLGAYVSDDLDFSSVQKTYEVLDNNFDGHLDKELLIEGAKRGLVAAAGDNYTIYMNRSEAEEFNKDLSGDVGAGIGVELGLRNERVVVLRVLQDNPAMRAGVRAGDVFLEVDGENVENQSSDEIAQKVRGAVGANVTVKFLRGEEAVTLTMMREKINNLSLVVEYDNDIAIIRISRFDEDTGKLMGEAAKSIIERDAKKVILDLRGNGGGYVSAAQDVLSYWLDNQVVLEEKGRWTGDSSLKSSAGKAKLADFETVVLVDGGTASASEIVAGALKEYGKATLVGTKTFGKGSVQKTVDIGKGEMLKITIAKWFTPKGVNLNEGGLEPDEVVDLTVDDLNANRDPQLDRAKQL